MGEEEGEEEEKREEGCREEGQGVARVTSRWVWSWAKRVER